MSVSSSAMACDNASTAPGVLWCNCLGLCDGAAPDVRWRPGSLVDAGRTVAMRARLLGLRLVGAGDATGLCCVKMMRGSRAPEAAPRAYGSGRTPRACAGAAGAVRLPLHPSGM